MNPDDILEEDMKKMAIADIKVGRKTKGPLIRDPFPSDLVKKYYNYNHLLTPEERKQGLQILVEDSTKDFPGATWPKRGNITARLYSARNRPLTISDNFGLVGGELRYNDNGREEGEPHELHNAMGYKVRLADLDQQFHGQGLGGRLYEAAYAHARNKHGALFATGGVHSSLADAAHKRLAAKHGLDYHSDPNPYKPESDPEQPPGSFDEAYDSYHYALKSEPMDIAKSVQDQLQEQEISNWTQALVKANSDLDLEPVHEQEHIPSTEEILEAAKFLAGGKSVDEDTIRRAMYEHDGDVEIAALSAYGLPTDEVSVQALRGVVNIQTLGKAEPQPPDKNAEIGPGTGDAVNTAAAIARAFKNEGVEPVKLKGKHSRGSLIATDPETKTSWLLKPGSKGPGPAAGVQEEHAGQSRREACFWQIADTVGLGETVARPDLILVNGREWAAIKMLPQSYHGMEEERKQDPGLPRRVLESYRTTGLLHKWGFLDAFLGNPDRHFDNMMVDKDRGSVRLIDEGSSMAGVSFQPSRDKNSFVPAYLRAWGPAKFNKLSNEDKLKVMPEVSEPIREELGAWLDSIHGDKLIGIFHRYGINPGPALSRLAKLKMLAVSMGLDRAVNWIWVSE